MELVVVEPVWMCRRVVRKAIIVYHIRLLTLRLDCCVLELAIVSVASSVLVDERMSLVESVSVVASEPVASKQEETSL